MGPTYVSAIRLLLIHFCVHRPISSFRAHRKKKKKREDDAGKAEDRSAEAKRREESEGKGLSARGQSRWPQSHLPHLQGFRLFFLIRSSHHSYHYFLKKN